MQRLHVGADDEPGALRYLSPLQRSWATGLAGCHAQKRVLVARHRETVGGQLAYVAFSRRFGIVPPIVEARRISCAMPAEILTALLESLLEHAGAVRRVYLSFDLGVGRHADSLPHEVATLLATHGFAPTARRAPMHTRVVPLDAPVDVGAPAWKGVRRPLRALARFPVIVRPIVDEALADRMCEIKRHTYERRVGSMPPLDYRAMIRAAARHPGRVHVVGCFRTDRDGPESLVAWDCATFNGVVGTSEHGARADVRIDDHALPSGDWALMACIRWAQEQGAVAFDLGGVTDADAPDFGHVKGINEFKARFGGDIVRGLEQEFVTRTVFDGMLSRLR